MGTEAWKVKVPVDRNGGALNFDLKEIGIDEFMAVQSFIEQKKNKEAIYCFFSCTVIGGDSVELLKKELDGNNVIPFVACDRIMNEIMKPAGYEVKKS